MIPVYIRDTEEAKGHYLGRFPAEALDGLVTVIRRWGIYTDRTNSASAFGEFFAHDGKAGFEIVVHDEDDPA